MNGMIEGNIVISILKFPFLSCIPFIKAENLQKLSAHQILLTSVVTKVDFSIWSVIKSCTIATVKKQHLTPLWLSLYHYLGRVNKL